MNFQGPLKMGNFLTSETCISSLRTPVHGDSVCEMLGCQSIYSSCHNVLHSEFTHHIKTSEQVQKLYSFGTANVTNILK